MAPAYSPSEILDNPTDKMMVSGHDQFSQDLIFLYGEEKGRSTFEKLRRLLKNFQRQYPQFSAPEPDDRVDETDSVLITYGDMVQSIGESPLSTLAKFLNRRLSNTISTVHILPFYPYSSDDGFSIINYRHVDPNLGSWDDINLIGDRFKLMFDAVINHISAESDWFKGFLANEDPYRNFFTVVEPGTDLSSVFRPRTSPLLTPVLQAAGNGRLVERLVWTTFSSDQIDLNFADPGLLLRVLEILLFYVAEGAQFIRLDAIAFIWKEIGTSCIHLPQTHRIIQLMRKVLDQVAPGVALITETNVPHQDNISYFGDGTNEAQMVYNFSLPPLTLHTFQSGNAENLSRWAESLTVPGDQTTYFNFLASHDGIGLTPVRGILSEGEINQMVDGVEALGGLVSYRMNSDGSKSPYELNINYLDALARPGVSDENPSFIAKRFLASQAIMLALRGVPGIYFHSLFGSHGWLDGVKATGRARTINREKLKQLELDSALADPEHLRFQVFNGYHRLLEARRSSPAFHPGGEQIVLFCHKAIFALGRISPDEQVHVFCLHNVTSQRHQVTIDLNSFSGSTGSGWGDLLSERSFLVSNGQLRLRLEPFEVLWLQNC